MPYLIVTNGSTGSGKASLVSRVIEHCKLNPRHTKYLIDDLIEQNSEYKDGIDSIITQMCTTRTLCPELRDRLRHPDDHILTQFRDLYAGIRKGPNHCGGKGTCDDLLDELLSNGIQRGENIVFETTGTYYVDWLVRQMPNTYTVYYAFTLVDFCENIKRNKSRAEESMQKFIDDRAEPAPRLPDVRPQAFAHAVNEMLANLMTLLTRCMLKTFKGRLLVLYNHGKNPSFIFDSERDKTVMQTIAVIENLVNVRDCEV